MQPRVMLIASQPQHTPAGKFLHDLYYRTRFLENSLDRDEYYGYPHNGGEHSLTLSMQPTDIAAFLSLVEETFPKHPGTAAFAASVRERFSQRYPHLSLM